MVNSLRPNTRKSSHAFPCLLDPVEREIDSFERFPSTGSGGLSTASPSSRRRSSWNTSTCRHRSQRRGRIPRRGANPIFTPYGLVSCIPEHRVIISSRERLFRANFRSRPPEHFGGLVWISANITRVSINVTRHDTAWHATPNVHPYPRVLEKNAVLFFFFLSSRSRVFKENISRRRFRPLPPLP